MDGVEVGAVIEKMRAEVKEMKKEEATNFLITGPYMGATFGLTLGAVKALQANNTVLNKSSLHIILRTAGAFSIAGLTYGLVGYYLTTNMNKKDDDNNNNSESTEIGKYFNRFLAGGASGLSLGAVERRPGFGILSGIVIGAVSVLERAISNVNPADFRIVPRKPPQSQQ